MDDTIYKVALAAFLHDIGKFAERAGMEVTQEYLDNNAFYRPYIKSQNRHTHKHAVYTAAFIEQYMHVLPSELNKAGWGLGDSFINLAAGHHKPETPLQWIITTADRVSSGMDRQEFEDYTGEVKVKDYKKTRLLPILEGVRTDDKWLDDNPESYGYCYPLKEISPVSIFPVLTDPKQPGDDKEVSGEYKDLFDRFVKELEKLSHKQYIPLWFEHLDSLFMLYTSHIPAATVGRVIPDVSLYDHSKTTAAIAAALYLYHVQNDSLSEEDIKNDDEKKLLIVTGDFYGIQDFIFSEGGSTNKASAKLLRGRSFAVSLLSELAAHMLCREAGVPVSSVVLNAAGKFTVVLPNTGSARKNIEAVEEAINAWLVENFYGEVSIGLSSVEASCKDFYFTNFQGLWEKISGASEKRKHHKTDLERYGGVVSSYIDKFNNDLDKKLCPFCGKRPSSVEVENDRILGDAISACTICRDHIYLGTNLVKADRIAVTEPDAEIQGDKLREPLFGRYQVSLDVEGKLGRLADRGKLIKYWGISLSGEETAVRDITSKFITGYVPVFSDADKNDETVERLFHGKRSEQKMEELFDLVAKEQGQPKPFNWLAKMALTKREDGKFTGIEALGVLKADIDHLGLAFACGMRHPSLSRFSTLSRQVNYYFTVYIPFILRTRKEFNDIYTVFAGGDDLFLIGPWNRVIEFASFLQGSFSDYVCRNDDLTISAGIYLCKPGEPVLSIAEKAEGSLKTAKNNGRDSVVIFGQPVRWKKFDELEKIKSTMASWMSGSKINNAMLYRFNDLIVMAGQEKELLGKEIVGLDELDCLKWKARFKYTLARNVGKTLKGEERKEAIGEVEKMAEWLNEYGYAMRIPLWQMLYNQR